MTLAPCAGDDAVFQAALLAAGLPIDDLDEAGSSFFALSDGVAPVGFGGLEGTGADRLLRSIVVAETGRGTGIGSRIVTMLADRAREDGASRLWLLTTGASGFFARLGWAAVARDTAPAAIAASRQFAAICPASASLMVRGLAL
jgi:amino-acid N-acetyltransferase